MDSGREETLSIQTGMQNYVVSILVLMDSGREDRKGHWHHSGQKVSILVLMDSGREEVVPDIVYPAAGVSILVLMDSGREVFIYDRTNPVTGEVFQSLF